ncbi:major facilitator superfamily transporter [Janthinobacterium sp. HH01]|uniref:MFS transporter n=1 Tax=Janthinobacterium sp. HH01 TaxID=1198452 RepID=UPI0002AEA91D|nr:MFS transporter [Janthinobacterium sp. HH01]ELX09251.1 major facilitator superfamily transporter [Janthinobacterium sp. HH01]
MNDAALLAAPAVDRPTPTAAPGRTPPSAWYSLAVLTIVTLIAFVDRNILVLQAEVIRHAMQLSDLQLAFLQGTAVAAFAAIATFPLGWLADRYDRRLVLAGCALFWSAAVLASGMAQTYEQLLLSSALVGAGEAGLVPIAYALIPEIFGDNKRQTANSIFAMASMSASTLALALSGQVIGLVALVRPALPLFLQGVDAWRLGFFAVALPAPLLVALIFSIRLRRRRSAAELAAEVSATAAAPPVAIAALLPHFRAHRATLLHFTTGLFSALFGFSALGGWLVVIYLRNYGVTAAKLGAMMGGIALVAMLLGFPLSVYGTRYFRARIGARVNVRALWLTCVLGSIAIALMALATSAYQMMAIHGVYMVTLTATLLVYPTSLQGLAPSRLRTRTVALIGMIASGGGALGPLVTGFVSDHMKQVANGLMLSAAMVSIPALLLAFVLLARSEKHYIVTEAAVREADAQD